MVQHAAERDIRSARELAEHAALHKAAEIYGMDSARVFADGFAVAEAERSIARAKEEAVLRGEFNDRNVELRRLEAEAAAADRQVYIILQT